MFSAFFVELAPIESVESFTGKISAHLGGLTRRQIELQIYRRNKRPDRWFDSAADCALSTGRLSARRSGRLCFLNAGRLFTGGISTGRPTSKIYILWMAAGLYSIYWIFFGPFILYAKVSLYILTAVGRHISDSGRIWRPTSARLYMIYLVDRQCVGLYVVHYTEMHVGRRIKSKLTYICWFVGRRI